MVYMLLIMVVLPAYEIDKDVVADLALSLNIDGAAGGRAVIAGHIVSNKMDIFAEMKEVLTFMVKWLFTDIAEKKGHFFK